jgi:hypothetical protein
MLNKIDIKSVEVIVGGEKRETLFKQLQKLFKIFYDEPAKSEKIEKSSKIRETYERNLFYLNKLQKEDQKHDKGPDKDKIQKIKPKQYVFTFFDDHDILINYIFSFFDLTLYDPLIDYFFFSMYQILIFTCDLEEDEDFEKTIELYKKFNSDFNFFKLKYLSNGKLLKNEEYCNQSKLSIAQDLLQYKNNKNEKMKVFLVFYYDGDINNHRKFKNYIEFFKNENVNYYQISESDKKRNLIDILIGILKFRYSVENENILKKYMENNLK